MLRTLNFATLASTTWSWTICLAMQEIKSTSVWTRSMEDSPSIGSHMISDSGCFFEKKTSNGELRVFIYLFESWIEKLVLCQFFQLWFFMKIVEFKKKELVLWQFFQLWFPMKIGLWLVVNLKNLTLAGTFIISKCYDCLYSSSSLRLITTLNLALLFPSVFSY